MTRYGMAINLDRCVGCQACAVARTMHHGLPAGVRYSRVDEFTLGTWPNLEQVALPRLCMNCDNAPCVEACPTGASVKGEDGIVTVDKSTCIGCSSCVTSCPYGARIIPEELTSNHGEEGPTVYEEAVFSRHTVKVAEKCDFCSDRLAEGLEPACVQNCIASARVFGDLDDSESPVSKLVVNGKQLLADQETGPNVYYLYSGAGNLDEMFLSVS